MRASVKLLMSLGAALAAGWASHGPLGRGEAFAARLEAHAQAMVAVTDLPGIQVRIQRDPIARMAILSGPANEFQREGQGSLPGLNDRVAAVPGISGIRWDENTRDGSGIQVPLLAETLLLVAIAWLAGLGAGRLLFRPRRKSFLG